MYNKAIAAVVAAIVGMLAQFEIEMPANVNGIVNALIPMVGAALVYFIPNKTA